MAGTTVSGGAAAAAGSVAALAPVIFDNAQPQEKPEASFIGRLWNNVVSFFSPNKNKPTAEEINGIAKEAVRRSPAMKELKERAKNLDPKTKEDLHNYMEGLKEAVAKIDTKKPQDASWQESVKATEGQNLAQR